MAQNMDDLTDEMMLDMTRRRLNNLDRRNKSLRYLAAQVVINNLDYFLHEEDQRAKISCLPLTLRKKLWHLLEEKPVHPEHAYLGGYVEFDKRLNALKVLLPNVKNIKISKLMDSCHFLKCAKRVVQVMQVIAAVSPRVQTLHLNVACHSGVADEAFLIELGKMKNLKKLEIWNYAIRFSDLKTLCREKLRQLEYIDVALLLDTDFNWQEFESSEDQQECFPNLKYFIYNFDELFSYWQLSLRITSYLHHCKIFDEQQFRSNLYECLPSLYICRNRSHLLFEYDLDILLSSMASDEPPRDLSVVVTKDFEPIDHNDLRVKRLREREESSFQGIPLDESLDIVCAPSPNVYSRLLSRFGATLHTLCLYDPMFSHRSQIDLGDLKLSSILSSCPLLEFLRLERVLIANESQPIRSFARLKRLEWRYCSGYDTTMSHILAAPELEILYLAGKSVPTDIDLITEQIVKGKILGKLRDLQINYTIWSYHGLEELDEPRFNAKKMFRLIKVASAFLPNLVKINDNFLGIVLDFDRGMDDDVIWSWDWGHFGNLVDSKDIPCSETLDEKTLCHFFEEYNRRVHFIPSVKRH